MTLTLNTRRLSKFSAVQSDGQAENGISHVTRLFPNFVRLGLVFQHFHGHCQCQETSLSPHLPPTDLHYHEHRPCLPNVPQLHDFTVV